MKSNATKRYLPVFLSLFTLFLLFACSTPSWFPFKKGPPHKAKMKELVDKEVIIIDKHEYVKVINPRVSEGGNQPKYLLIPVEEYLAKKEAFAAPSIRGEEGRKTLSGATTRSPSFLPEKEALSTSVSVSPVAHLKKKVVVAHFNDRTTSAEEAFGDWLAERLMKEMMRRPLQVLFVDYQLVKGFLEARGISPSDLESPKTSRMLSETFGIHAIVLGEILGPYVFTTKGAQDQDGTSTAIIKIEMKIIDTFSGKTLKTLAAQNSIVPTKEKGLFSDEKAKGKAFDLTLSEISRSLSRELDRLDWFCRVARVDGEEVYINAGRLSGLKVGDVMEVLRPGNPGERGEVKGKIQISTIFGMDASVGKLIQGKRPNEEDILKLAGREGS
ncbi:MAG: hypothetical protein A2V86_02455 [Deltaproteobacteria bacterium RBG_16_49_23]|nr:MAG: hypothetical protein A2V86_02455 [Deltaproteobacteria bacterium RBG_16_49_23]